MKTILFLAFLTGFYTTARAQQPLTYTGWADGVLNAQLAKSNLYGLGLGGRAEVSKQLPGSANALFAQLGYTHFVAKGAITADVGLVNVGYRYQSRRAFNVSTGVGVQYWRERMRIRFPDYAIDETLNTLIPSATVGMGVRINTHYRLGLENRLLVKPGASGLLRNTIALSIGYTF